MARFWSQVLGWPLGDDDKLGADEVLVEVSSPMWGLLVVREAKAVKNRSHIDWMPDERTRDEEIDRLVGLGARLFEDRRTSYGLDWVTLQDPEGNEFRVERSTIERGLTGS